MLCTIWYHLYNFKNVENAYGGVLLLVKLQAFKSNTRPWVFFTFLKLYKWYQIAQRITNIAMRSSISYKYKTFPNLNPINVAAFSVLFLNNYIGKFWHQPCLTNYNTSVLWCLWGSKVFNTETVLSISKYLFYYKNHKQITS